MGSSMNYEEENRLLYLYGLHLACEGEAGEASEEVWQLGATDNPVKNPEFFTREEALAYVKERLNG